MKNFELTIGEKYHVYNGYASVLGELWFNNSELVSIEKESDDVTLLTFKKEDGSLISIDQGFVYNFNPLNKQKCYMFIEKVVE